MRSEGNGDLSRIKAVVLETNGKISVISDSQYGNGSAVLDVLGGGASLSGFLGAFIFHDQAEPAR